MLRAEDLTPGDLFNVLWRRRYALIGFALGGAALAYGYSLFVPDTYTAETLVLVEDSELPREYAQATTTVSLRARLNTLSEQVLSRTRLEDLVAEYDLAAPEASREAAVARVRRRIGISVIGTDGFRITFTHEDPRMAARVANALAGFFIAQTTDALENQVRSTASGIQAQLDQLRERLDSKEGEIGAFKAANMEALPTYLAQNLNTIQSLRQQLRDNETALGEARAQLNAATAADDALPPGTELVGAREVARSILAAASDDEDLASRLAVEHPLVRLEVRELQRASLLRRLTERHPDVRMLSVEIAALQEQVRNAPPYEPGTVVATNGAARPSSEAAADRTRLARTVGLLEANRTVIRDDLLEYQSRVDRSPGVEMTLREMERVRDGLLSSYNELSSRNMEADLASDLQSGEGLFSRFQVIDAAVVPEKPASPLRLFFLIGGALAGAALVVVATLLHELLFEPITSAAELARFADLEVLASIPGVQTARIVRRQRIVRVASASALGTVLVVVFMLRVMLRGL